MNRPLTLQVTGMTCDHCARTVEDALSSIPGVKASVSYEQGIAQVESPQGLDVGKLLDAIRVKGYGASLLGEQGGTPDRKSVV